MICPRCGNAVPADGSRCTVCGAAFAQSSIATQYVPIDTTGLPPGATFGASVPDHEASATVMGSVADAATMEATGDVGTRPTMAGRLTVGQAFGPRYHIIKLLGAGGMGAVYQAWDAELGVAVAVKVIRLDRRTSSASSEVEKRFKNELLLARKVTHRNVVRIHDLGEINGIKYITMPYVQGDDLATVLRREHKLPVERALRLARQISSGLEAAHEAGVVHRDLKPANIMIGADDLALIMDFGISASASETSREGVIGTLEYMAPEQSKGEVVDSRADIYAFGLMLHEMLTGPRPASATARDRFEAMKQRTAQGVPSLRAVDPTIPEPLDALVSRCLERDPAARFQTPAELSIALATLDDVGELLPIAARISKRVLALSAVMVLLLLAGMYVVGRRTMAPPVQHEPVSVLIADFQNGTGDATFDHTLEPMLKLALEGAGFISAYDRNGIGRTLGVKPPEKLDERAAQELAVKQGLGVVLSGSLDRQGNRYQVSVKATQAVTGTVITSVTNRASSKDQVVGVATRLAELVRRALGDDTSDSAQRFAMETLSATSLDVVREYARAMDALSRSRFEDARQSFAKAVAQDPKFGLAYAGLAMASWNLDKREEAGQYAREALSHLDGMTERERYRTRGNYYLVTNDYQSCVKEYGDLIARFAADASARNNLALCLTQLRDMPKALDEMRHVVKILPNRALYRQNLALYADYGGDFQTAEQEVLAMPEPGWLGLLALAFSQVGQGQLLQSAETYRNLGRVDAQGASYTVSGLADLAIYEGRFSDATRILEEGAAADIASKDSERAANKLAALAYTHLLRQQKGAAIAAAEKALANSRAMKIRFLVARVFIEAGVVAKARTLADSLAAELPAEPQAYAKIIEGDAALANGNAKQAIKALIEANSVLETWIGHFDLGRAYLDARAFTNADGEFDRCVKRRGEALALFLDEDPTYAYLPPVYYYQGRAREGLKTAKFADSYRTYLDIRGKSSEDPLLPEVRRRSSR
jgi:eukaryotic-like serine/threonine-protein kinase